MTKKILSLFLLLFIAFNVKAQDVSGTAYISISNSFNLIYLETIPTSYGKLYVSRTTPHYDEGMFEYDSILFDVSYTDIIMAVPLTKTKDGYMVKYELWNNGVVIMSFTFLYQPEKNLMGVLINE